VDAPRVQGARKAERAARTAFDVFGKTNERRTERQLIADYERTIEELLAKLDRERHATAVAIASIPRRSAATVT